jgi:L-fucose isomerase-like protein
MGKMRPRVGVLLASHVREPSSFSLHVLQSGLELLKKEGMDILFNNEALASSNEIRQEIRALKNKDVDAYILCPGNWIEPPVLCHPLEEIRHENILLWGFPESLAFIRDGHFLGSNSAFTVLRNAMHQMDFRFRFIQELPNENLAHSMAHFCTAAAVSKRMKRARLGLIGYCSMGIYTASFDPQKIRAVFGTEIDTSADSYILYMKMKGADAGSVKEMEKEIAKTCEIDEKIKEDGSLTKSIQMYLALKKMAVEQNWAGLSVKCQHEFSTYLKCTACLPLSLLTDEGIMCTDEGDIHALLTMVIMRALSNEAAIYFGDIYKLSEGGFLMDHCGLSPHSCAEKGCRVSLLPQTPRISKDGKTTGGVVSSYTFEEGDVTIGRIENDRNGTYLFHLARGNVKPIESIGYGWSSLVFTPDQNDEEFAARQLANHYVFVYDDIRESIRELCTLNDIKVME